MTCRECTTNCVFMFCQGMHLVELCSKLNSPVPYIERLVSPDTVDAILVYPEIDDRYSEDPLVAGLNGYRLDLPTRKPSYSDVGPKSKCLGSFKEGWAELNTHQYICLWLSDFWK